MNFKEIYEQGLTEAQQQCIESSYMFSNPTMITGIISPESSIVINSGFQLGFQLDKEGMLKIIEMFEKIWNAKSDTERKNLFSTLVDIYLIIDEYFGGIGDESARKKVYLESNDGSLSLSEFEGKNIGLCAEKASTAHQLLSILQKAGYYEKFDSYLACSYLISGGERHAHSFVVLRNKDDISKHFLFDVQNLLDYKQSVDSALSKGIGLYSLTDEECKDFENGKSVTPQSIYEKMGWIVMNEARTYGNGRIPTRDGMKIDQR